MSSINSRRDFLKFLGYGSLTLSQLNLLQSCTNSKFSAEKLPSSKDDVVLADGLNYYKIISWNDPINPSEVFGFNNDYIDIQELSSTELIMWINHEYANPLFVSGIERTKINIDKERSLVGGSLIQVNKQGSRWIFEKNSPYNRGVRSHTKIPFANNVSVKGSKIVEGTLANCAGGKTPWNTFLSCEENYDAFYGERDLATGKIKYRNNSTNWHKFYPENMPEHYGWVVEIDPYTGSAQKHTNLGRFAHESATCAQSKDSNVVVYSGDDKADECLYKFVSNSKNDLKEGILYVANIEQGKWLPLDLILSPVLKEYFDTQLDVVTYARGAAKIVGGTGLNRPEDIEIHPYTGDMFVALTNNKKKNDWHGSILKISEKDGLHTSTEFTSEIFKFGGAAEGFSSPDNLAFDKQGNLWMVTDISGGIGKGMYRPFKNNGLFLVPNKGKHAGKTIQVGSAPNDAEFTGLCFSLDEKTLFLSVQHPGERTKDLNNPTSHWPDGGIPKPSVIAIHGDFLEQYTQDSVTAYS